MPSAVRPRHPEGCLIARDLKVTIVGDSTALQAALARASGATSGFASSVSRVGQRISSTGASLTKGLTLPILGIGAISAKSAVDFQNAMELLHTQAGVAQGAIAGLSKSVLSLAGPTATAPDELAAGLYHLESQGLRGAKAIETLHIAAQGAKMGQADLEDVTNALGAVISSRIGGVKNYSQAMGELNATVGAGDMRMQDLADAMGTGLAAKLAVAHVGITDMNAALAVFGDNNIRGAEAGTLLASTVRVMEGPSGAAQKKMAKLGVSAKELGTLISGPGGLVSAITYLDTKLAGKSSAEKYAALTQMFGSKQAGGVLILSDQLERLKQKEEAVRKGGAAFASDWSAYTKTAAFHLASMGAAMQASGITIGDILLPVVSKLVNEISRGVTWFDSLSGSTKKFILIAAGIAATLGPALSIIGSIVSVVGAIAGLSAVAAVVLGVVGAVALLAAGIAAAVIWPKQMKQALEDMGLSAQRAGQIVGVLQSVFAIVKTAAQDFVTVFKALWARFGDLITAQARTTWNMIRGVVEGALNILRGLVNVFAGLYHGDWSRVWQGIQQIFSGAWQIIKSVVIGALQTMEHYFLAEGRVWLAVLTAAWHAISASASAAWSAISKAIGHAVDAVTSVVKSGFNKVLAFIKSLPGEFAALGEAAGKALLEGVARGIEGQIGSVLSVASKAKNAVKSIWHSAFGSTPDEWGNYAVGTPLMQGIAAGIAAQEGTVKGAAAKAKQSLKDAMETRDIYALVMEYGHQLGLKQAEGVVGGILTGTPSIVNQIRTALQQATQQARQAVIDARSGFQQAFGQLASEALSAFDQKVQAWVPPAQKLLNKMQAVDQVNAAQSAVDRARGQLTSARSALSAAQNPNDPNYQPGQDVSSLIAQVTQAQAQVDAALRAQKEQGLQLDAAQQQAAYDKRMATQREQLAKQLVHLQQALLKHPAAWKTMGDRVERVLTEFGVRMVPSGEAWSSMFANGIRQGIPAAEAAAHALAAAVDRYMPHSPAKVGPLSTLPNWGALLGGLGDTVSLANGAMSQMSGVSSVPSGSSPRPAVGTSGDAGGDVVLELDGEVLARFNRRQLTRKGKRNVAVTFGTA